MIMNFLHLPFGSTFLADENEQNDSATSATSYLQYIPSKSEIFASCSDFLDNPMLYISLLVISSIFLYSLFKDSKIWKIVSRVLRLTAKTIIGAILLTCMIPLGVPLLLTSFIISMTVKMIILLNKSYTNPRGLDTIWGSDDMTSRPFITVLLTCQGTPDIEKLKKKFQDIINEKNKNGELRFRKFRQNLVKICNFWFWKDVDNFNINNHIRYVDVVKVLPKEQLKKSDSWYEGNDEEYASQYLSDLKQTVVPLKHPQWEVLALDTGNKNSYSLVFRFHHGIADGISLVRLMLEKIIDNPYKLGEYKKSQSLLQKIVTFLWSIPLFPYSLQYIVFRGKENEIHGPKLTGNKIFVSSPTISMSDLRLIKNASKTGITDILFSCLSAALAKFFNKRGASTPEIVIGFPVGFQDLRAPLDLSNIFGMALTSFPTKKKYSSSGNGDSVARLKEIKILFDEIRSDPSVLALFNASIIVTTLAPDAVVKALFGTSGLSMGVSNMPGPKKELIIAGDKVTSMRFWVPDRAPTGTGFTMVSYMESVQVSFCVDRAIISNRSEAQKIIEDFMDEIQNMKKDFKID